MFDSAFYLLAQSEKITNWFTPVWVLSLGVAIGFALALAFVGILYLGSRVPKLNAVGSDRKSFWIAGSITFLFLVGAVVGLPVYWVGWERASGQDALVFWFVIPALAIVAFGSWVLISKARVDEMIDMLREGLLKYVSYFCLTLVAFGGLGLLLGFFGNWGLPQIVSDPRAILQSLARLPISGWRSATFDVSPTPVASGGDPIQISLNRDETRDIIFQSNQQLDIATEPISPILSSSRIYQIPSTSATTPVQISTFGKFAPNQADISELYVANRGDNPAKLTMYWFVAPAYTEVTIVPIVAFAVAAFYILFLCSSVLMPKISAIGLATFKTEIGQPLFLLVLLIGAIFVVVSIYVPYNTFGEDIKMYKDSGLTLIKVLSIFAAIWAASKSVAEEIEGRTALTVLSKPVGRREFILGKFFGISMAMGLLFLLLGSWFIVWVSYKPVYDAVETAATDIQWSDCFRAAISVIPVLVLAFFEVVVFVAISIAISTRFGILANLMICFSIYVLGHLTPQLVQSRQLVSAFEPVVFFGQLVAIVFPVLDNFDAQAAINTDTTVPLIYLGWAFIYTALYGSMAVLLALVLFEDRDLA